MGSIFICDCIDGILPSTFSDYLIRNIDVHQCNRRRAYDLWAPFVRLDVRQFRIKDIQPKYGTNFHSK